PASRVPGAELRHASGDGRRRQQGDRRGQDREGPCQPDVPDRARGARRLGAAEGCRARQGALRLAMAKLPSSADGLDVTRPEDITQAEIDPFRAYYAASKGRSLPG